jgi:hypothetical protein
MKTKTCAELSDTNSTLIVQEDMIVDFILYDCTGGMSEEQSQTVKPQNNTKQNSEYRHTIAK